ncbi:MAG: methylated-DNA--[protein]-cysteine S-methyltransferase [Planctomycetota bacterium]
MGSLAIETGLGPLTLVAHEDGLARAEFGAPPRSSEPCAVTEAAACQLLAYFRAELTVFEVPLAPIGTDFQRAVWRELLNIPFGETRSYSQVAAAIGRPNASRAVGAANGANPIAIFIPCHRVIGQQGGLTGYAGGLERKRVLLDLELGGGLFGVCAEGASGACA